MSYEEESQGTTSYYRCIDPIDNFKIKVVIKPVKGGSIPLPAFNIDQTSPTLSPVHEYGDNEEEYTFKWQEKIFSRHEVKKYSTDTDWKKKINEKCYDSFKNALATSKNYPKKLFSYIDIDNYAKNEDYFVDKQINVSDLKKKVEKISISDTSNKNFRNFSKTKIINYYPSEEFKKQSHTLSKNLQKMFIMIDLGTKIRYEKKHEKEEICESVLCSLSYNLTNNVLEINPSISESQLKPYIVGADDENMRNAYYYWIYHASPENPTENLSKELNLMSKVFDRQDEFKKVYFDSDFIPGKPNHLYVTLLGEISDAEGFEYNHLYIHYFIKLSSEWEFEDVDSLIGTTQSSNRNSEGIYGYSHLFEMNYSINIKSLEEGLSNSPELFFEVLSIDKYNRYRNEGYTYVTIPKMPGVYNFTLRCWRPLDNSIKSQLNRFFIGGGPELEDVSYVGLSTSEKVELRSRFGFRTIPTGQINIKLNILHQSDALKTKSVVIQSSRNFVDKVNADTLLGSVNTVLEAFRKARERMLQAKKELENESNDVFGYAKT